MQKYVGSFCACVVICLAAAPQAAWAQEEPGPRDEHRVLQLATAGSLLITATLGTLTAINKPTLLSEGACAGGRPVLGDYGCHGLSILHGISGLLSTVLYTATLTLELSAFDWPGRDRHGGAYEALSYVHLIGMSGQALGGVIASFPEVVGASRDGTFARVLRTLHIFTGYLIVGSFGITTAIEL